MTTPRLENHVSLATAELERSVAFYRALFGAEPVLERHDYVRFWPSELGLVLALDAGRRVPRTSGPQGTGALQHLGILYPDGAQLLGARERLTRAGFRVTGQNDTLCCHARLDQFWATDPSGVRWELVVVHEAVVAEPASEGSANVCCSPSGCT